MTETQIEVKRLKEEAYQITKRYFADMARIQRKINELHGKGAGEKRDRAGSDESTAGGR